MPPENDICPSTLKLPTELPLIVLSDCYHFPGCFLPLYIFEDRYRAMLAHVLKGERMFGVGVRSSFQPDTILPVATAGLVRACVKHDDGTSHLMLLGLKRMQIVGHTQTRPFPIALVEPLETTDADDPRLIALRDEALESLPTCPDGAEETFHKLKLQLHEQGDPEAVCDILTYHFIRCPDLLTASLLQPSVRERYRLLLGALHDGGMKK